MRHPIATVPGTAYPFPAIAGGKRPELRNAAEERQRRGLLAKVHIAKKEMGLNEGEYEMILRGFKAASAAHLTIAQLENMVKLLKHYGWKPARPLRTQGGDPVPALRARCVAEAALIPDGTRRLAGLAQKICGTAQLAWCHDAKKLKMLLAILMKLQN